MSTIVSPLPEVTSIPIVGPVVGRVMENPRVQRTVNFAAPYVQPVVARAVPIVQSTVNFTQPYVQPVIARATPIVQSTVARATPIVQSTVSTLNAGVGYVQQFPQQIQGQVIQPVMARAVAAREGVISTAQPVIQPVMARALAARDTITAAPGQILSSTISTAQPLVQRSVSTVQPYVQPYVQGIASHRYVQGSIGLAQRVTVTGQAALSAGKTAWAEGGKA